MDPLHQLWELYEDYMEKPELRDEPPATMGTPDDESEEHPVTVQRKQVDTYRAMGMSPEEAHMKVYGDVDTGSSDSKAQIAATFSRVQDDNNISSIPVDKDSPTPSIMAKMIELEKDDATSAEDLKTRQHREVSDRITPEQGTEQVDTAEEMDYNDDVAYLQKYGRA